MPSIKPNYPTPPPSPTLSKTDISATQTSPNERRSCQRMIPSTTSTLTPVHQTTTPTQRKRQVDAPRLKVLLGLDRWWCGAITLKEKPCQRYVTNKNKDQVNEKVELLTSFTQSSLELEPKLDDLVNLVHCYQHCCGHYQEDRIDAWIKVFPVGEDDFDPFLLVSKQVKQVIGRISTHCAGTTLQDKQCMNKIGGQRVQNCMKTIREIVRPEVHWDDASLQILLQVLAANTLCSIHFKKTPLKNVGFWKSSIMKIRADANLHHVKCPTTQVGVQSTGSKSLLADFSRNPLAFWPVAFDASPFDVIRRHSRPRGCKTSQALIHNEMKRPLDDEDRRAGFIYLYEVEGNRGYVKLGYTARSPVTRHTEWSFDCNRNAKLLFPTPPSSATVVPSARRVEALCHAELDYCRIWLFCSGCLKQHIEWFETSPADAMAAIRKWSNWMSKN